MRESDLVELRVLPKVFPQRPYARHTAGLGAGDGVGAPSAMNTSGLLSVKVLGLYCSRITSEQAASNKGSAAVEQLSPSGVGDSLHGALEGAGKRHIYVRVQFDKTLVDTLPLEVMREKYPQVLIDYLLSTAVWT
ncbi:hypothetical protein DQ04_01711070 [Trypanosoma grayi]|uniref:hypothetical protein n=1 Tax=Trypanosoma grayi TaxID=71804 RepID=UPI0004F4A22D|nr:hypothetical protein DQ04_01711070 [Trypanosoma grayi]KEG12444.1 hypothetical protein DQ04_01711070 [Trypanosoma grayi]